MTARSSTGNFSKFGTYFLYKLRTMRPLIILNSIFALLSYPLVGGILVPFAVNQAAIDRLRPVNGGYLDMNNNPEYLTLLDQQDLLEGLLIMSIVIGVIMLVALFIMSNAIIVKNFRWLYSKTVVDMDYSLPVSDDTRFFGDLLSSFAGSLVPHLIAILSGSALWRVALSVFAKELTSTEDIVEYKEILGTLIPEQVMYTGLFSCIMFMAFTLFVMSICGRRAETGIYSYILTGAVTVIHVICQLIVMTNVYGMDYYGLEIRNMFAISSTSPLGLIFVTIIYLFDSTAELPEFVVPLFRPASGVTALLITAALFAAAYFLIRRRRVERVGSPFVFGAVKAIVPAIVTFAVVLPFMWTLFGVSRDAKEYSYEPEFTGVIVAMFILTFILYIIMELISGKGFKKFHITLVKYIVTMAVSIAVCFGLYVSNGFGAANYVPDVKDIQSVEFDIYGRYNNYGINSTVKEQESIGAIVDIHKEIPKKFDEKLYDSYGGYISIEYQLKDGTEVSREYKLSEEKYLEYLRRATTPEAFYNSQMPTSSFDEGESVNKIEIYNGENNSISYEVDIPYQEFEAAYRKDCDALTYEKAYCLGEDMYYFEADLYCKVRYDFNMDHLYEAHVRVKICSWMENTIALLEKYGVDGIGHKDTLGYRSAFLVAHDADSYATYTNAEVSALFMMTGDTSASETQMNYYGLPTMYTYSGDDVTDNIVYETTTEKGQVVVKEIAPEIAVVNYQAIRLDIDDPVLDTLLENTSPYASPLHETDKYYSVVLVGTEDLTSFLSAESRYGFARTEYFISFENYELAAQLMAA